MERRTRRTLAILVLLLAAVLILLLVRCTGPKPAAVPKTATANSAEIVTVPSEKGNVPGEVLTSASIKLPGEVLAGATFEAAWTGPDNPGDYLTIVRPTATPAQYENYRETRHGRPLPLTAPIEAGEWEVRYIAARSKTVLGRARLNVVAKSAELTAADEIVAGAPIAITWIGPNNAGDYITIVPRGAADEFVGNYGDTRTGSPLTVAAPVDPGEAEIRYVSGQGRRVLGRRKLVVLAPDTSISAQAQVTAGAKFAVTWKGPGNAGDYLTVVPRGTPDGQYRNYTDTTKGSPLELTAPMEIGAAEIRYMTGSRARVLARRAIEIVGADVSLSAPDETVAGAPVKVVWSGPNNPNDYLTIVPATTPDGQYGNYRNTAKGSPLTVSAPMRAGPAEIRYMSGQGAKVLARRPLAIVPAQITLEAPADAAAGNVVFVAWKGPNNPGDYLTIVPKSAKDGVALQGVTTARGTPAKFTLPKETGPFEIRYMSGQGNLVLARTGIQLR